MGPQAIYTIGCGKRTLEELITSLQSHAIDYVVDVRSSPYSGFKPEFSREPLQAALQNRHVHYVFMGDQLGGRPQDPSCYVDGKVDYERMKSTEAFRRGIERLRTAWSKKLHVCLLCSEGHPWECHRSKLIGEVLTAEGISVLHIDAEGKSRSQEATMQELTGGQASLWPETWTSRKRYEPTGE